jgi:protocatechuate 3,4-dioxygenase beta subunit
MSLTFRLDVFHRQILSKLYANMYFSGELMYDRKYPVNSANPVLGAADLCLQSAGIKFAPVI